MQAHSTTAWLKTAVAIVIGFGIVIASAAYPPAAEATRFLTDLIFWPVDGAQSLASPEIRLLCAVTGGVMVGWGFLLWLLITRIYPRDPGLARTMILWSGGSWFVIDSAGSIIAGAPLNAVFNIGFLLLFVIPLALSTKPAHV